MAKLLGFGLCVLLCASQLMAAVELEIPAEAEAEYSDAVLSYQSGDSKAAVTKLASILRKHPENLKALELQGLALKSSEEYKESTKVFLKLRKLAREANIDGDKALSYEFQIGTLLVQLQKHDKAKPFLTKCLKGGFNVPVAKFYLGIIAMEEGDLREAQAAFRSVVRSDVDSLKAPSHFYLGVIAKRRKEDTLAESNWKTAKEMAEETSRDPASAPATRAGAKQLVASVDALLNAPSKADAGNASAFFGSVGVATGYDTNVLLNPSVDIGATGQSTPTMAFRYSAGYVRNFSNIQIMPLWQGSMNYNFNSATAAGQFFSNDWNVWANYKRGDWRYGMRAGASLVLRNFVATGSTSGVLKKQSFSPTFGPNIRYEWGDHFAAGSEAVFVTNTFYSEESLATELQKTGWEARWRNYFMDTDKVGWWNPTYELNLQYQYTEGTEFRSLGVRTSAGTTRWWNDKLSSSFRLGVGYITYPSRASGTRTDIEVQTGLQTAYDWRQNLRLTMDLSYLNNLSNITDIYKYNRIVASVAADYQF